MEAHRRLFALPPCSVRWNRQVIENYENFTLKVIGYGAGSVLPIWSKISRHSRKRAWLGWGLQPHQSFRILPIPTSKKSLYWRLVLEGHHTLNMLARRTLQLATITIMLCTGLEFLKCFLEKAQPLLKSTRLSIRRRPYTLDAGTVNCDLGIVLLWYCIAGNFGEVFNLVIWWIFPRSQNLKLLV